VLIAAMLTGVAAGCGHHGAPPSPVPTPIGVAPAYHPATRALPADPRLACTSSALRGRHAVHLELFANRLVVIVPAAIGIADARESLSRVVAGTCKGELRTLDPTGTITFDRDGLRLRDFFRAWGRTLSDHALLSFRGPVGAFVNGKRWVGAPTDIPLWNHDEIVVEISGYVLPHAAYLFPKGR
jgi:hypothetical protein